MCFISVFKTETGDFLISILMGKINYVKHVSVKIDYRVITFNSFVI